MQIRLITSADNQPAAQLIRQVLTEFGANRPGFAWQDPELDTLAEAYAGDKQAYYVLVEQGNVVGTGGFAPFACHLPDCAELQKMYLLPAYRGLGWGRRLIECLLSEMQCAGFRYCYLETLASMQEAVRLYERQGFKALAAPLGNSGHNACDQWYLKEL